MRMRSFFMLLAFFLPLFSCQESSSSTSSTSSSVLSTSLSTHVHALRHFDQVDPTCTEEGTLEHYQCSECDELFLDSDGEEPVSEADLRIAPLGHDFGEWAYDPEPTCTEGGHGVRVCSRCQEEEEKDFGPLGHDVVAVEGKDPTCTEDGYTEESYCSRCGEVFEESRTLPALGHDFVDGICTRCGAHREATQGLEFELSDDGSSYTLVGRGESTATQIYVPEEYDGLPVKEIGSRAFRQEEDITLVDVPSSVVRIGDDAFNYCSSLSTVHLSEGLEEIGEEAFYACLALESIALPSSLTLVAPQAFSYSYNLREMMMPQKEESRYQVLGNGLVEKATKKLVVGLQTTVLPEDGSVTIIGEGAYYGQAYLSEIALPDAIDTVEDEAFYACQNLSSVDFGDGLSRLGNSAFASCSLKEVDLKNVLSIGQACFGMSGLETLVFYPENVFDNNFYTGLEDLKELRFQGTISQYCDMTCFDSKYLSSTSVSLFIDGKEIARHVTFTEGITHIPAYSFRNLKGITSVTLPSTLVEIGSCAFEFDTSLTTVYNHSDLALELGEESHGMVANYALSIQEGEGDSSNVHSVDGFLTYEDTDGTLYLIGSEGKGTDLVFPDSIEGRSYRIKPWSFANLQAKSIIIPEGCVEIGRYAFYESTVESVQIDGVEQIGDHAFYSNANLSSLVLSEGTLSIGSYAFGSATFGSATNDLTEVALPDSLRRIEDHAFQACRKLTTISFGTDLEYIGKSAFYRCNELSSATFAVTSGWKVGSSEEDAEALSVNVGNASTNATNLRDEYRSKVWFR